MSGSLQSSVTEADRQALEQIDDALGFLMDGEREIVLQAFARHRITAAVEARKELIAKGCIHAAKAGERGEERADIRAWQEAQSEFFDATICEIVSEYAAWRDGRNGPELANAARWLLDISELDLADIVADGGITAGMVVQQEARNLADKLASSALSKPDNLTAATQLHLSGLITDAEFGRMKNALARESVRGED